MYRNIQPRNFPDIYLSHVYRYNVRYLQIDSLLHPVTNLIDEVHNISNYSLVMCFAKMQNIACFRNVIK